MRLLLAYDGSADAQSAIDHAARLLPGAEATVLAVWEPFVDVVSSSGAMGMGMGLSGVYTDCEAIDTASKKTALARASEGADRATAAGLVGRPRIAGGHRGVAEAVLSVADEIDADVIVLGTRGITGVRSFFLGSVSHAVLQHAGRAVLVVPSPAIAEERRGWARRAKDAVEG